MPCGGDVYSYFDMLIQHWFRVQQYQELVKAGSTEGEMVGEYFEIKKGRVISDPAVRLTLLGVLADR